MMNLIKGQNFQEYDVGKYDYETENSLKFLPYNNWRNWFINIYVMF